MNVTPGTLFIGDNLPMLRGINSGTVDLVYLDPPFHTGDKKRGSNVTAMVDGKKRKQGYGDAFDPSDLKREWFESIRHSAPAVFSVCEAAKSAVGPDRWAYLIFMGARLLEIRRVLKPTGSCWLHCDWHADGWLRALMDAVFGAERFINVLVWWYYNIAATSKRRFGQKHDVIIGYAKGEVWTFNADVMREAYEESGWTKNPESYGDTRYAPNPDGKLAHAVFRIPAINNMAKERTGWEDQKPRALLDRIILACSNRGDVVLDPFCGCATALVSAQVHHRAWIGIDQDPVAEGVLISGYWTPKGEKRVGRLVSEAGLLDASKVQPVAKTPALRTDGGETACDLLESEFKLRQQQAAVLTKAQQARLRRELYIALEGKCQGLVYADGSHVPCRHGGMFLPIEMFELDHIRPRSKGGKDTAANFQLGCSTCNGDKAAHLEPPKKRKRRGV